MEYIHKQEYELSAIREYTELMVYSAVCFFVPFVMGHPQWFVGIAVNTALVLGALNIKGYKILPIILLPSIAVLSRGLIFGALTPTLVYLIPFIWISNTIIVLSIKYFRLNVKISRKLSLLLASGLKAGFLTLATLALFGFGIISAALILPMSILQFGTALAGGAVAFGVQKITHS